MSREGEFPQFPTEATSDSGITNSKKMYFPLLVVHASRLPMQPVRPHHKVLLAVLVPPYGCTRNRKSQLGRMSNESISGIMLKVV